MEITNTQLGAVNPFSAAASSIKMKPEDFIKIMMAQLSLQDPFKPTDSGAMLEQLAQLSSLSSNQNLSETINALTNSLSSTQAIQASSIVGRNVQVASYVGVLTSDGLNGGVILPTNMQDVKVIIKNQAGQVVKELQLGSGDKGTMSFKWDGTTNAGSAAPAGLYIMEASGKVNGETIGLNTAATVKVNSVTLTNDGKGLILNLDSLGSISIKDILQIL